MRPRTVLLIHGLTGRAEAFEVLAEKNHYDITYSAPQVTVEAVCTFLAQSS